MHYAFVFLRQQRSKLTFLKKCHWTIVQQPPAQYTIYYTLFWTFLSCALTTRSSKVRNCQWIFALLWILPCNKASNACWRSRHLTPNCSKSGPQKSNRWPFLTYFRSTASMPEAKSQMPRSIWSTTFWLNFLRLASNLMLVSNRIIFKDLK